MTRTTQLSQVRKQEEISSEVSFFYAQLLRIFEKSRKGNKKIDMTKSGGNFPPFLGICGMKKNR